MVTDEVPTVIEPEEVSEVSNDIVHTELLEVTEEEKPKHAGGRPRKDRVRVNIKLTPELQKRTEDVDRSQLIIDLLNAHFGLSE